MSPSPAEKRSSTNLDIYAGKLLRILRKQRGLSQSLMAEKAGISFQQLQKYESGKNRISISRLILICSALNISPAEFISKIEKEFSEN